MGSFSRLLWAALVAPFLLFQPAAASTVSITGGLTQLALNGNLPALGFTAAAAGTASFDGETFTFPISGGSVDGATGNASIAHEGVGVMLSLGGTSATVGDFLIDTAAGTIFGTVNGGGSFVDLFTLAGSDERGIRIRIAGTLAGALSTVFGAPDLTGETIGFATTAPVTAPAPVPLPAGMPLLLAVLAVFGALRLRARRTA